MVSGGLFGRGLRTERCKAGPLPMSHSDFIYAIIGEETGLLGSLFVLALFVLLAWRGYQIAFNTEDRFSSYVAFVSSMSSNRAVNNPNGRPQMIPRK